MILVAVKFFICTVIILYCGKRLARYGDAIAEKTGLGGLLIGVMLTAVATSLPELFTGVGSTVFVGAPDLTVGNLLGANTYNLVNIAILDFLHKGPPLLSAISAGQLLTALLGLIPLSIAATGILVGPKLGGLSYANISLFSVLIAISYPVITKIIFKFEKRERRIFEELHKEEKRVFKYDGISLKKACFYYGASAVVIAASGIWLAYIGDELARIMNFSQNFIGTLFLGFATTLPEMTVSIAALRMGAKELAVASMLGSNIFNVTIISANDLFYRKAPIFNVLSQQHIITAFVVIFMTAIVGAALVLKPKHKTRLGLSAYAIALAAVFAIGACVSYLSGSAK